MNFDQATEHVRRHLKEHGFAALPSGIKIRTEVGDGNPLKTVVSTRHPDDTWPAWFATRLTQALGELPGADARLHPVRDRIDVVWHPDGQ